MNPTLTPKIAHGATKSQNQPQNHPKSNVRIERTMKNKSCSATWVDQKTVFEPKPNPKNNPLGPKNGKNDPKIRSNSNVRIEGIIENKSCSTTWLDPRKFLGT